MLSVLSVIAAMRHLSVVGGKRWKPVETGGKRWKRVENRGKAMKLQMKTPWLQAQRFHSLRGEIGRYGAGKPAHNQKHPTARKGKSPHLSVTGKTRECGARCELTHIDVSVGSR